MIGGHTTGAYSFPLLKTITDLYLANVQNKVRLTISLEAGEDLLPHGQELVGVHQVLGVVGLHEGLDGLQLVGHTLTTQNTWICASNSICWSAMSIRLLSS